jgi:hypothetical protein
MINVVIPTAPALPANAPVTYELYDYSTTPAVLASTITLNKQEPDFVPQDAVYAMERGAAAWHRCTDALTFGDFKFGAHLFVSHAGNTTSGTQPLLEVVISIQRAGDWKGYPFSADYDKKRHVVFPKPFKIVAKDAAGNIVHTFQMHDNLPINDPSLFQGSPLWAEGKTNRPKVCAGMVLPWWNELPRRSASLEAMYSGITEDGMRPSAAKSHFSVLGCEPQITGGYSGWSLNSLANIWVNKEWPMPKGSYWPEAGKGDPYFNYNDTCMDGRSAFMGPWIEGYRYEPGSRTTHNWYCAPGGPRFDRAFVPSQIALFMTDAFGKRQDGVSYSTMAYEFSLAYCNHPNKFVTDATTLFLRPDADLLESKLYFTGNYYGDGGPNGPDAIALNANQRDGSNDSHFDVEGTMPFHGWGRDSLHDYATAAHAAIAIQSPMMMILSKFDTTTAFMSHGGPDRSGVGSDGDGGNYLVRDMAWDWLHQVLAYKMAANHPLGFKQEDILNRFSRHLEAIHRDILTPIQTGNIPAWRKHYFEGIVRFGQPISESNGNWEFHGGGLAFYLGGVLMYLKQSGMYAELQQRGGKAYEALMFTIRNACQYAFGLFSQTKATMFSNPWFPKNYKFADGSDIPADWKELSLLREDQKADFNTDSNGNMLNGDRDVSVHPTIQFIYVMRDFYPEIEHPWKEDAIAKVDMYLKRQTERVKSMAGNPQGQRDADHIYRYPGVAPLKAPKQVGKGNKVELPTLVIPATPVAVPVVETVKEEVKVNENIVALPVLEGYTWKEIGWEGGWAEVGENSTVAYGIDNRWTVKTGVSGGFKIDNSFFGDPAYGSAKKCLLAVADPVVPEPVVEAPVTPVEAPQAAQNPVEPEPVVVETPVVVPVPDYAKALETAAVAFLQSLGYTVAK